MDKNQTSISSTVNIRSNDVISEVLKRKKGKHLNIIYIIILNDKNINATTSIFQSSLPRRTNAKTHRYLHNNPALERTNPLLLSRWSRGSGSGLFEKTRSITLAWLHVRYREIIASQFVRNGRAFRKRKCRRNQKPSALTIFSEKMLNNQRRICEYFCYMFVHTSIREALNIER